jgi:hypothetical protein
MATDQPTFGTRVVPIDLPADHIAILRADLTGWLEGMRLDLKTPERLRDPERSRREAAAFERMLAALARGELLLPDEEAWACIGRASSGYDEANEYAEIAATHDAHHGLLGLLGGGSPS